MKKFKPIENIFAYKPNEGLGFLNTITGEFKNEIEDLNTSENFLPYLIGTFSGAKIASIPQKKEPYIGPVIEYFKNGKFGLIRGFEKILSSTIHVPAVLLPEDISEISSAHRLLILDIKHYFSKNQMAINLVEEHIIDLIEKGGYEYLKSNPIPFSKEIKFKNC